MKIIHVLNTNKYSGAENVAITTINQMKKDNDIVYVSPDGKIREYLEENNIMFEPIKKISISELRRVIKKYNPDIIHAHDFTASVISAFVCGKKKLISHIHNNVKWLRTVNLYSLLYLISSIKYNKILLVSESIIKEYIFKKFIQKKVKIIGNPIDINKIIERANEFEEKENYDIIFLGRFSKEKNPTKFISLIKEISKDINIKAIMIGDGELKDECKKLIEQYNMKDLIEIKDFQKNPYPILKKAKILCMTSEWEGYGLVAIEALTLSKPVVATEVGGIPTIVTSDCGVITNDINNMKNEIKKLLNDSKYYEEKSINALERAEKLNNIDTYISNLINIYVN